MKKRISRILSFLLVLALTAACLPALAFASAGGPAGGLCGDSAWWEYDGSTGTLTISGTGAMYDYTCEFGADPPPYSNFSHDVQKVVVSSGITRIGSEAFGSRTSLGVFHNLRYVQLPSTLESIGDRAFCNAHELAYIDLPGNLKTIGEEAFFSTALQEAVIPVSVTEIGRDAFDIDSLGSVRVVDGNKAFTAVDGALYRKVGSSGLELVVFPKGIAGSVALAKGLTSIPDVAFYGNGALTSVTVPAGVKDIGRAAFAYCGRLTSLTLPEGLETFDTSSLIGCHNLYRLDVPASVTVFSNPDGWSYDFSEENTVHKLVFHGMRAPEFKNNGLGYLVWAEEMAMSLTSELPMAESSAAQERYVIYYPVGAAGWDEVMAQPDVAGAIEAGAMEFHTWTPDNRTVEAKVKKLTPAKGSANVGFDAADPPVFCVTFDRAIAEGSGKYAAGIDLTLPGAFAVYRSSDDELVYSPTEYAGSDFITSADRYTLAVTPVNRHALLEPDTDYYITMAAGAVTFVDGSKSPAIRKDDWTFRTLPKGEISFIDVKAGDWYYEPVHAAFVLGLLRGMPDGSFVPNGNVTRAQAATALWNLLGCPAEDYEAAFTDVREADWFSGAVMWAYRAKITNGVDAAHFGPNDGITREQLAVMVYRCADLLGLDTDADAGTLSAFPDQGAVDSWARDAIAWAVERGIINGANGLLVPRGTATRAELAKIITLFASLA